MLDTRTEPQHLTDEAWATIAAQFAGVGTVEPIRAQSPSLADEEHLLAVHEQVAQTFGGPAVHRGAPRAHSLRVVHQRADRASTVLDELAALIGAIEPAPVLPGRSIEPTPDEYELLRASALRSNAPPACAVPYVTTTGPADLTPV